MSYLYSRALAAEYLADTCSDGAPFAPSSGSPTPQAYCAPDKMTAFSRPSRFGMTFAPLTAQMGFDARWGVVGADDVGAPQHRERIWILADANHARRKGPKRQRQPHQARQEGPTACGWQYVTHALKIHEAQLATVSRREARDAFREVIRRIDQGNIFEEQRV